LGGGLFIFDLMQPAIEGGTGDAEIAGDLSPGDLEGLDVPEDEPSLADGVSWVPALSVEVLRQDRDLHFELVDPVFEKEDLRSFGISILGGQAFQAALAHPSREARREQGGPHQEGNGGIEDLEIVCHGALSEVLGRDRSPIEGHTIAAEGAKCQCGIRERKCLLFKGIG
jgi:hypothetical protein